jgi:hypothetical protein
MHLHASRSSVKWFWVSTASIGCDWEGGRRAYGRGRRFPPFEPMLSMSTAPQRAHTRSSPDKIEAELGVNAVDHSTIRSSSGGR